MKGRRLHGLATLALSLVAFALSACAAALGAQQDSLFIEPGRVGAPPPLEAASGR
jgi:hypothetical protein